MGPIRKKIIKKFKKFFNILQIGINCIAETNLKTHPILLAIEPTNICNVNCVTCPNDHLARPRGYMDKQLFQKIVDETIDFSVEYSINMLGEPTQHKNIIDMIKYIKEKGGKVALFTNLNYQNDEISRAIVENQVDRLVVNVSATDAALYQKIMKNGNYSLMRDNLEKIKGMRQLGRLKKPTLVASFLKIQINAEQGPYAIEELKKIFDYCFVKNAHDWRGDESIVPLKVYRNEDKPLRKCSNLWTTSTILWDGRVAICCHDYDAKIILGDANVSDIFDIWNSQELKKFRKSYRKNLFCQNCNDYMAFQFTIKNLFDYFGGSKNKIKN